MSSNLVLIVSDNNIDRHTGVFANVECELSSRVQFEYSQSIETALVKIKRQSVVMVVSQFTHRQAHLDYISQVRLVNPTIPVFALAENANVDDAVSLIKAGATDYLTSPVSSSRMAAIIKQHIVQENSQPAWPIACDANSKHLLALARKVALSDVSVMILGPSGSGKEVLARYIHQHSARSDKPFIAINCAAIPESMLEATLFGYQKGAFTGAVTASAGKFEQAQGGTILLDEITEMDLSLQAKMLRVIQEREVERLGSSKTIQLNVRILATSNRQLKQAVVAGEFREDLYYRLNVFPLTWLPLKQRKGDIIPMAEAFLHKHAGNHSLYLSEQSQQKLLFHDWPGNVRELDNVMQRALILKQSNRIEASQIIIDDNEFCQLSDDTQTVDTDNLQRELRQQEFQMIQQALKSEQGSRKEVAKRLGISERTLRYKLAKMRESGVELLL
ncbi:sigma-54 dependent transcriptional regulator [Thalassotalea ponticola]|uniref:sigma-54-dependent transcriptional regulator n=1 Tax=Thalassotalea ponticola TaxID=1523392 RepID=UPI0025B3A12F|nr:sigma-54 dependent transcriptional regulator [Thalassotalea ponticola]MDN3651665.1 sigma-54 dependent transcriptional regulator [Thalassotalea ponticola]